MQDKPKISIITTSKNTGKFVKETIESILAQTYKNWEHIVVDGVSTDETRDVIKQYPHIRLKSEPDNSPNEAFLKGLAMAKGEYIMLCCISDGYLDKNWFKRCVEILDSNPEISLVWGNDQNMLEDGALHKIVYNSWFENPPPSGSDYIYYWLKNGTLFHERDFCVRKNVVEECFSRSGPIGDHAEFAYNFNRFGYLPYFIPVVAAYGRQHRKAASQKEALRGETERNLRKYYIRIEQYKRKIISGEIEHRYRNGYGRLLRDKFDLKRFLESEKENKFKKIITYLTPPIFIWFRNRIVARYRVYQNYKKIRKNLANNSEATSQEKSFPDR
jgi:glycosyltransferase involved in cell wall biosynthesis